MHSVRDSWVRRKKTTNVIRRRLTLHRLNLRLKKQTHFFNTNRVRPTYQLFVTGTFVPVKTVKERDKRVKGALIMSDMIFSQTIGLTNYWWTTAGPLYMLSHDNCSSRFTSRGSRVRKTESPHMLSQMRWPWRWVASERSHA